MERESRRNPERFFKIAQAHLKQDLDLLPLSQWTNRITLDRHITQRRLAALLGLEPSLLSMSKRIGFSIFTLGTILENATPTLNLTEDEESNLADIVCDTLNQQLANGRRMQNYYSHQGKNLQKQLLCITFTGGQAAEELGVSRETIRLQRKKHGISHTLLTESDFEVISQDLEHSPKKALFRGSNLK